MSTAASTSLDLARGYLSRGFAPVPVAFRDKRPTLSGWQNLRLTEADLPRHFNGKPQNIGVLLGEPSGWLVDVDLDHPEAVALAREYLPSCDCRFGRKSKPESHYFYRATGPIVTTKFQTDDRQMVVELRSTGCQTVAPGSVHPSGEPVEWDADGEPPLVDPDELLRAVEELARAAASQAGLVLAEDVKAKATGPAAAPSPAAAGGNCVARCRAYLAKLPAGISGQGGHAATLTAACACFRFGLSDAEAAQVLDEFNARCAPPWNARELAHKLTDASAKVQAAGEFGLMLRDDRHGPAQSTAQGEVIDPAKLLTDVGNAARFVRRVKSLVFFCYATGRWHVWNGKVWKIDDAGEVVRLAKETALAIADEAKAAAHESERKDMADWFIKSQKRERITAMVELAKPDLAVRVDELDADDWLLNVSNGVVDLRIGTLLEHDPARRMTKLCPIAYEPQADAPLFQKFMARVLPDDYLIEYVQRYFGSSLTGDIRDQILAVFYGTGANGKSTLLELIAFILGDYADNAPPDLLLQRFGDEHPCEVADLLGLRLAIAAESEKNRRLKVNLMKRLTGESTLKARFMRENFFTFRRTFKLVLVTNNKPRVDEDSEAVWRRLKLIPFNVVIPPAERDPNLAVKLRAEAPGVLAWLVRGCLAWQRDGLPEPAAVVDATSGYRAESDPLAAFLADCCDLDPSGWTSNKELRNAYEAWSAERGDKPVGGSAFTESMRRNGCKPER